MDVFDHFRIDDLLDFSNEDIFSSSSTDSVNHHHITPPSTFLNPITAVTHDLCLPSDDVAELEWLSQFVDDSFSDLPGNSLTINGDGGVQTLTVRSDTSALISKSRSKRSKAASLHNNWISSSSLEPAETPANVKPRQNLIHSEEDGGVVRRCTHCASEEDGGVVRRCTHCASEKTPQWRTGPLGPKTLCNACGVRYKSGRLVPEYRPAASPTFVLTQHSNSHRKVLELRRQKDVFKQQQHHQRSSSPEEMQIQMYHRRRHQSDFEAC